MAHRFICKGGVVSNCSWGKPPYSRSRYSILHGVQGVPVDCDSITRREYYREYSTPNPSLDKFAEDIWCYTFKGAPQWMRFKPGASSKLCYSPISTGLNQRVGTLIPGFQLACSVNANLNRLRGALRAHTSPKGARYWSLSFNVCISFGRTEHRAFLEWQEEVCPIQMNLASIG